MADGKATTGPKYDFGRLSVLIVDDSGPSRTLLARALGDLGIGVVRTVASGAAAIEYLKNTRTKADQWANNHPVDILVASFDMDPVDGLTLLRWVRNHAASPNRFMRVSLTSGAMSWERVSSGRTGGASALFAKPFTIKGLGNHISGLIRTERPFVHLKSYFGPDRRREDPDAVLSERRDNSIRDQVLGQGKHPHIGWFELPNYLEMIATGTDRGDINYFDLAAAHELLLPFSEDFGDWVWPDLIRLQREFDMSCNVAGEREYRQSNVRNIAGHIIRQASALDYPLMAHAAQSLIGVLNYSGAQRGQQEKLARLHFKAMENIASNKLDMNAGASSDAVVQQLRDLGMVMGLRAGRAGVVR